MWTNDQNAIKQTVDFCVNHGVEVRDMRTLKAFEDENGLY
jgi:hypothetical protein